MQIKGEGTLMKIENTIVSKEFFLKGGMLFFALFPIIPNSLKGLPVITLLIAAIVNYKKDRRDWKAFFINASLYLTFLISLIYTNNFDYALRKLETGLSILVLPMIFFLLLPGLKVGKTLKLRFYRAFLIATTIFSLFIIAIIVFDDSVVYYRDWYSNTFRTVVTEAFFIGQHPVYASVFLSLSILFYIELSKNKAIKTSSSAIFLSLCVLINLALLIMLMSKGVLLALTVAIVFSIATDKKLKRYNWILFFTILLAFIALFTFNRRMNELLKVDTYKEVNQNFSTGIRVGIYQCSLGLIKQNLIFGYGVGDSQDILNTCYTDKSELLLEHEYNTHNQYLDLMLKMGGLGLGIFLGFLMGNISKAQKNGNKEAIMVILLYAIVFLTENILARQSGVILFYFLLLFLNTSEMVKLAEAGHVNDNR